MRSPNGVDKALNGGPGATANAVARALRKGGQMVDLTGSASIVRPDVSIETDDIVQHDADDAPGFD